MLQLPITCLSYHSHGQRSGCRGPWGEGWGRGSIVYSPSPPCRVAEEKAVPEQLSLEMYVGFWNLSKHFLLQQTRYHWVPHRLTWGRSDSYPKIVKKGPQGTPEKELTSGTTRIGISSPTSQACLRVCQAGYGHCSLP